MVKAHKNAFLNSEKGDMNNFKTKIVLCVMDDMKFKPNDASNILSLRKINEYLL